MLHNLVFLIIVSLHWKSVNSLRANGENVCSTSVSASQVYTKSQSYKTSYSVNTDCGLFGWNTCTKTLYRRFYRSVTLYRTVYSIRYDCCDGYTSSVGSNECTVPTCEFGCVHGTCESSNFCRCDKGYYGPTCQYVTVSPTVMYCSISIQSGDGIWSNSIPCQTETSSPAAYSNVAGSTLFVLWQTRFYGSSQPIIPSYFLNDYKVGITSSAVSWVLTRGKTLVDSGKIYCDPSISQDNPTHGLHRCTKYLELDQQLQNQDSLFITAYSANGGFLRPHNYENYYYYDGKNVSMYLEVIIDLEPPTHCSISVSRVSTCVGNSLDIGDPYTRSNAIEIRWSQWVDYISGMAQNPSYVCRVYRMAANNSVLYVEENIGILNYSRTGDEYRATLQSHTLTGVYCVVLTVDDVAGNIRNARRCFIFDNQSEITIIDDNPIYLTVDEVQLNNNTNVTITGDEKVIMSWKDHFVNHLHINESILLAINTDDDIFKEAYDSDASPRGRPLSAIDNRNGIVKFEFGISKYALELDIFEPVWKAGINNLSERIAVKLDMIKDSGTFGLWVRATDVIGNTKTEMILIDIDFIKSTSLLAMMIYPSAGGFFFLILIVTLLVMGCHYLKKHKEKKLQATLFPMQSRVSSDEGHNYESPNETDEALQGSTGNSYSEVVYNEPNARTNENIYQVDIYRKPKGCNSSYDDGYLVPEAGFYLTPNVDNSAPSDQNTAMGSTKIRGRAGDDEVYEILGISKK